MKPKQNPVPVAVELASVFLVTVLAFVWGRQTALAERGCDAIGGEYLLLLLPLMYYSGKRIVLDWVAEICDQRREDSI